MSVPRTVPGTDCLVRLAQGFMCKCCNRWPSPRLAFIILKDQKSRGVPEKRDPAACLDPQPAWIRRCSPVGPRSHSALYWGPVSLMGSHFNYYLKLIQIALLTAWLLQCSFVIQFLFKINTNCSPGSLAAPVLLSYSIIIQN